MKQDIKAFLKFELENLLENIYNKKKSPFTQEEIEKEFARRRAIKESWENSNRH